jgi:hypothetical protein
MTSIKTDAVDVGHGKGPWQGKARVFSEALVEQVQIGFDGEKRRATSGVVHDGQ